VRLPSALLLAWLLLAPEADAAETPPVVPARVLSVAFT